MYSCYSCIRKQRLKLFSWKDTYTFIVLTKLYQLYIHRVLQEICLPKYIVNYTSAFLDLSTIHKFLRLSKAYISKIVLAHFLVHSTIQRWYLYISLYRSSTFIVHFTNEQIYIIYYILYRSIVSPNLTCTFLGLSTPYNPCSSATKSNSEHDLRALLYPRGKRKMIFVDITSDKMLPGTYFLSIHYNPSLNHISMQEILKALNAMREYSYC